MGAVRPTRQPNPTPRRVGATLACGTRMSPRASSRPDPANPASPPERMPPTPDTVPTGVPPERPFSPEAPDVMPGAPHESPVPGLPPEVGPAIAPVEVPPLDPGG